MSSLALMYNLAILLFALRVSSKFGRSKEANNYITGLEIATHWLLKQPRIECWCSTGCQWATRVFFCQPLNLKGKRPCLSMKGTICLKRSNNANRGSFNDQLNCHIWFSTFFSLGHKLNNVSTVNPSFFFAVKTVNIRPSHRKTSKWLPCSKFLYDASQTLEH